MRAIILAAGKGTRLRPLTYGIPKVLLPVKGRPIIDWVIRNFLTCGEIDEIFIAIAGTSSDEFEERMITQSHGILVESYLKNLNLPCKVKTIPTTQRESGGDLRYVLEETCTKNGTIVVGYGDNLTEVNLQRMLDYHRKCREKLGIKCTLLLFEVSGDVVSRMGIAKTKKVDGFDLIEYFIEKPEPSKAPSRLANAGYYVLELDDVFDLLPKEKLKDTESFIPALAKQGKLAGYIEKLPFWIDIGTIEAYEEANRLAHENLIIPPPLPNLHKKNISQ